MTWSDAQLEAIQRLAARALIALGEPGTEEDVIRRAEYDGQLRARLEGASVGVRSAIEAVRGSVRAIVSAHRRSHDCNWFDATGERLGAQYVERHMMGLLGPASFHPGKRGEGVGEVLIDVGVAVARSVLAYTATAVPSPDAASAAALRPVLDLLAGEPVHGWVNRSAAATFVAFVEHSAPSADTDLSQVRAAQDFARRLADALDLTDADPSGLPVRVKFTGPQLYAISKVVQVEPAIRPWRVMDALRASWADMERPKTCRSPSTVVKPHDPHGGTLTMNRGAADWLQITLAAVLRDHGRYRYVSSSGAARAIAAAVGRARGQ